jgi:hypothetical protein
VVARLGHEPELEDARARHGCHHLDDLSGHRLVVVESASKAMTLS